MRQLIILVFSLNLVYANCHEETGWCFSQSTLQAFYFFQTVKIDDSSAVPGEDIVSAWLGEVLVGWFPVSDGYTVVPAMGNDGDPNHTEYCQAGDVITFKVYDRSTDLS